MNQAAVAAGHPETAAAAAVILEDGGSAVDAAIAAMQTACVAEPVLASLGGGGFALVVPPVGPPRAYDFFPANPLYPRPPSDLDFQDIEADFGTTTQTFHIGQGTAAVPGLVRGMARLAEDFGRLTPVRRAEPAIRLAKAGVVLNDAQASIFGIVAPILLASDGARARFCRRDAPDQLIAAGDKFDWPSLADALDGLAHEGDRLFYEGEIAGAICAAQQDGGQLTADDLKRYAVDVRPPLRLNYEGWQVLTNPEPAVGGTHLAFLLGVLEAMPPEADILAQAMRIATALALVDDAIKMVADGRAPSLHDPALIDYARQQVRRMPWATRGTTHICVTDRDGMLVSATLTNGEGCGRMAAGDAFMVNNMLGEADLNPKGFHTWTPGGRLGSLMAPTALGAPDGRRVALGTGGSARIPGALAQVIVGMVDHGRPPDAAIERPRLHVADRRLDLEGGTPEAVVVHGRAILGDRVDEVRAWPSTSPYFGGVQMVATGLGGTGAHADSRRGGAALVI